MLDKYEINKLKNQIKLQEISQREERYTYLGLLGVYQKCGVQSFSYKKLNSVQHKLFKEVLHGRGAYKREVYDKLPRKEKVRIRRLWQSGQRVINNFKNQVCNAYGNIIFSQFKALKFITKMPINKTDSNIININTLKELGITYDDLILVFMKNKLLPKNFLSL